MITYEQIQKANEGLTTINLKGKEYTMVPQRVKAFRMLYPEGFILTNILSYENGVVLMQAEVGYYENGNKVILGTGLAQEVQGKGPINSYSVIENCETSAVGRALGFCALGIESGICSAEELVNALAAQRKDERPVPAPVKETPKPQKVITLPEIREKLDSAIKAATKDMSRAEKLHFLNTVVTPTLQGERNWRLCEDLALLQNLLTAVEQKAA